MGGHHDRTVTRGQSAWANGAHRSSLAPRSSSTMCRGTCQVSAGHIVAPRDPSASLASPSSAISLQLVLTRHHATSLYLSHFWAPLLLGALALIVLAWFDADRGIASTLFFSASDGQWIGRDSLWMNEVLHTAGRDLMRLIGVLAIGAWAASFRVPSLRVHRRALGYFALCMALVPLVVGGLKTLTNVDCPWDVAGFGGTRPYAEWSLPRPDGLPHAACFPGAHSSSAFALFALYFLWRDPYPQRAQVALVGVLVLGGLFSLAQQSRGAHFLSHDLASALIAWLMCFGFYLKYFEGGNKRHAPHD